ncbi:hypothetical protein R1flu_005868 [Riccia fluitans]|uniref:Uncharacterized protein n=1 Tax=Riccia fluitans TaxID=41844 RepID=A0ABD1YX62_9MARC
MATASSSNSLTQADDEPLEEISFSHGLYLIPPPPRGQLALPLQQRYQAYEYFLQKCLRLRGFAPSHEAAKAMVHLEPFRSAARRKFFELRYDDAIRVHSSEERDAFLGIDGFLGEIEQAKAEFQARETGGSVELESGLEPWSPFDYKMSCLLAAPPPRGAPPPMIEERASHLYNAIIRMMLILEFKADEKSAFEKATTYSSRARLWDRLNRLRYEDAVVIGIIQDIDDYLCVDEIFGLGVRVVFRDFKEYTSCVRQRLQDSGVAATLREALQMMSKKAAFLKRRFDELTSLRRTFTTMEEYDAYLGINEVSEGRRCHHGSLLAESSRAAPMEEAFDTEKSAATSLQPPDGLSQKFFLSLARSMDIHVKLNSEDGEGQPVRSLRGPQYEIQQNETTGDTPHGAKKKTKTKKGASGILELVTQLEITDGVQNKTDSTRKSDSEAINAEEETAAIVLRSTSEASSNSSNHGPVAAVPDELEESGARSEDGLPDGKEKKKKKKKKRAAELAS